ncbi:MAG: oxidoreductase [Tropicimonas sp.]|uniref:oxidoreductase n=1 Tax=Tropicimonas sp. TaxID=2067044 RepID=UPI003A8C2924
MSALGKSLCVAFALMLGAPLHAGEILLSVSGDVAAPETGDSWTFDMEALRALPSTRIETTTIWTEGRQSFEGVSLDVLLDHVGAAQGEIEASALNDYTVTIPTDDAVPGGPIIAYLHDGKEMSVREKGPLWIMYPFDDNESYRSEDYYARSIWQLDRLRIVAKTR